MKWLWPPIGLQLGPSRRWLVMLGLLILLAFLPFLPAGLQALAQQLLRVDELPTAAADVAIALGGGKPCQREAGAIALYRAGKATHVLVSGNRHSEQLHLADWQQRKAIESGVPAERVMAIRDVFNTRTEAQRIHEVMRANGWRTAIVVTSAFHSRRALYTLERGASDLRFYSRPLAPSLREWEPERWWGRRRDAGLTVRELLSWVNTWIGTYQ